jgi:hypothetical protein
VCEGRLESSKVGLRTERSSPKCKKCLAVMRAACFHPLTTSGVITK